jgi:putative ABC transport system permease protein
MLFRGQHIWEAFRVATASLRANKLRTALTLMGIVVGVAAVISVVTIIKGLNQTVAQTFSSQGSTVFSVSKNPQIIKSREEFIKANRRKDVTHEDAEAIQRLCTACWRVGIAANAIETVKYADQKAENVRIRGVEPITMFDIDGVTVNVGRIWTESEGAAGRDICVIGPDMLKNLFNDAPADRAVGQEIRIDGRPYVVLGVLEPLGSIFGFSRDNVVYIPYSTYQKAYGGRRSLVVFTQVRTAEELEVAEDQVRTIMQNRRHSNGDPDDEGFALETQDVFLNLYGSATSNIYIVTIGVAAISLVVGGIVVMNQGDWHSQGDRRESQRHPDAVFDRSGDGNGDRRTDRCGHRVWACVRDLCADRISVAGECGIGGIGCWCFFGGWDRERLMARVARREIGSHRSIKS